MSGSRHVRPALLFLLIPSLALADGPPHRWSKRFGDADSQYCRSVDVDPAGNVVIGGSFGGWVNFGGASFSCTGTEDFYLAKFHRTGAHLWSRSFGPQIGTLPSTMVATDPDGSILFAGDFYGSIDFGGGPFGLPSARRIFLAKFDGDGNHLWSACYGVTGGHHCMGLAVDGAGNVFLTGYFSGTVDFGGGLITCAGGRDIFLAKLDGDGNHVWSRGFGDESWQYGLDVALDVRGGPVLTGGMGGSVDFGGGPLITAGSYDFFLARFDEDGNHVWSSCFGDETTQGWMLIDVNWRGDIVATGNLNGTVDFGGGPLTSVGSDDVFLALFDESGDHLWSCSTGDTLSQQGRSVSFLPSGAVVATGFFSGTVDFGGGPLTSVDSDDIFLVYLDPHGNHLWSGRYGAGGGQQAWDLAVDGPGNVLLTGFFMGSVDFGGTPLVTAGYEDIFLVKFGSDVTGIAGETAPFSMTAFPTPFNAAVAIELSLPDPAAVSLQIFDARGRIVRTLARGAARSSGQCRFVWHGEDDRGLSVASGTYIYRLQAGDQVETGRVTLLK